MLSPCASANSGGKVWRVQASVAHMREEGRRSNMALYVGAAGGSLASPCREQLHNFYCFAPHADNLTSRGITFLHSHKFWVYFPVYGVQSNATSGSQASGRGGARALEGFGRAAEQVPSPFQVGTTPPESPRSNSPTQLLPRCRWNAPIGAVGTVLASWRGTEGVF